LDLPHLREGHDRDVAGARLEELVGLQEEAAQHIAQLQARAARGAAVPSAVATDKRPAVAPEYLREIVGVEFGQTPERVARTTKEALQDFAQETRARIRGQDHALKTVEATLRRRLTNAVPDGEGPLGAYVFSGPTGVGKTAVALAINGSLFVADSLFRLDMSEYMEKHSVSRLIGAPPGYVGFDEGGVLTNAVHENGERVILFDEIEKAHEDVRNILLQVLGSGRLTDGNGTVVDFKNTIVVVTTNIGAEYSMDRISMGVAEIESKYGFPPGSLAALSAAERDQRVVERLLKLHGWKDEEINRYSALISMNPISEETAIEIVRKNLDEIVEHNRRENHRVVTYDENVPVELARASLDPLYGARPLKRSLVSVVGGAISTAFLDERLLRGQVIRLSIEPGADGPGLVASAEDTPLGRERLPTRFFGSTAASREMAGTSEAGDGASSDGPGAERAAGVGRCGDFFGNARGRTGIKRDGASAADELIPGLETLVVPERFRARAR
jgi:ATP-dependent Clp protease ATP-binding subunit ClpA